MSSRTRHLIFLAHLWLCAPFVVYWFASPKTKWAVPAARFAPLQTFVIAVCLYVIARTVLAYRPPSWLKWEYVFPPIDVAIVSLLIYLGDGDPISNTSLLYFFAVAEAAGTLSLLWSVSVGGMVIAGAAMASGGFRSDDWFNTAFQYSLILVMASLLASLARASSKWREQQSVARDRSRIAMEMHDGVQAHLITIASQMELAERIARKNPARAEELASESKETARLAADELRFLVQRLRAPTLSGGFLPALKQFAHNLCTRTGMALEFISECEPYELEESVENALFRIAQESLTNVVRHAKSYEVRVEIEFGVDGVGMAIRDNGVGFDSNISGSGLEGMTARAKQLGGRFALASEPGKGTTIDVWLPRVPSGDEQNG